MGYLNLNRTVKLQQWGKHFGREHLCKIILNLGQWLRKMSFKLYSTYSSGGHFVQWSKTFFCAILKEGLIANICVNSFCIWTSSSGEDDV